jgi:hypothetical protein
VRPLSSRIATCHAAQLQHPSGPQQEGDHATEQRGQQKVESKWNRPLDAEKTRARGRQVLENEDQDEDEEQHAEPQSPPDRARAGGRDSWTRWTWPCACVRWLRCRITSVASWRGAGYLAHPRVHSTDGPRPQWPTNQPATQRRGGGHREHDPPPHGVSPKRRGFQRLDSPIPRAAAPWAFELRAIFDIRGILFQRKRATHRYQPMPADGACFAAGPDHDAR